MTAQRRRGAAAIEWALIVPVLLVVVFALFDWSWYFFEWMTVTRAAAQGVRVATGRPPGADPTGRAEVEAARWLESGLASGAASIDARITPQAEGTVLVVEIDVLFQAPIDVFWTPDRIRTSAQGIWYGDQFEEAPAP